MHVPDTFRPSSDPEGLHEVISYIKISSVKFQKFYNTELQNLSLHYNLHYF